MNIKRLLKQAKKRLKEDNISTLFYRIIKCSIIFLISLRYFLLWRILRFRNKNKYVKKEVINNKMYLDLKDPGISYDLFKNGIREPFATEFFRKEIKTGNIIVDIGANIGYYVLQEAELVGDAGKIYAIEPIPQNINLLKKNIKLNNYSNIEVFKLAMGGENKISLIYITTHRNLNSMVNIKDCKYFTKERIFVKTITLDKFLENKPSPNIIRMDTEGYEVEIIKGMRGLLSSGKPLKLFIEIHPNIVKEKIRDLLIALKSFGFQLRAVSSEPSFYVQCQPEFIKKIFNRLEKIAKPKIISGYHNEYKSIDDLLNDKQLMIGKKAGLETFFERT